MYTQHWYISSLFPEGELSSSLFPSFLMPLPAPSGLSVTDLTIWFFRLMVSFNGWYLHNVSVSPLYFSAMPHEHQPSSAQVNGFFVCVNISPFFRPTKMPTEYFHLDVPSDAGRDWGQEQKGKTEDKMAGWHHRLNGCEFEWTPGDGDGQGGLVWCSSWGC